MKGTRIHFVNCWRVHRVSDPHHASMGIETEAAFNLLRLSYHEHNSVRSYGFTLLNLGVLIITRPRA